MKDFITIKNISQTFINRISRISADVGGELLWFESSDIRLKPAAEGFVSAMLVPALRQGTDMVIESALDRQWFLNIHRVIKEFRKSWKKYRWISITTTQGMNIAVNKGTKTALSFSGGVDSFYSLLCCGHRIDYLVFIHGFDIPLRDAGQFQAYLPALKVIAEKTAAQLIVIRTNIRELESFRSVSWIRSYGSVMAGISHFIPQIGKFIVSASYFYKDKSVVDSRLKTDPLFSSSSVDIIHEGAFAWRSQKIRSLIDEPLVRKYLRVCWEHKNEFMNCCQCEKCIRTMLSLQQSGKLDYFETFPLKNNLLDYIKGLPALGKHLICIYNRSFVYKGGLGPELEKAVYALLKRSYRGLGLFRFYLDCSIGYCLRKIVSKKES